MSEPRYCSHCGGTMERFLSVETVSRLLDCSPETIRGWVRERKIGSVRVNGLRRIPAASLHEITTQLPSIKVLAAEAMAE